MSTVTTEYGTWANHGSALRVEDTVIDYLGDGVEDWNVEAIANDFRALVNAGLPAGVSLAGDNFYGPYPLDEQAYDAIAAAIEEVDLAKIIERHDPVLPETCDECETTGYNCYLHR